MLSSSINDCIQEPLESLLMTKAEPDPLVVQLGTYACALFDLRLCWSVQRLHSGLDHGYEENFKQWPRE